MKWSWSTRNLARHNWTLLTWLVTKQIQKCLRTQFSITLSWVQVFIFFKENQAFFLQLTSLYISTHDRESTMAHSFRANENYKCYKIPVYIFQWSLLYFLDSISNIIDRFCNWNWLLFLILSTKKTWTSPISWSDFNTFWKIILKILLFL